MTATTGPCAHEDTIPVESIGSPAYGQESAPIITVTGHRCLTCSSLLPATARVPDDTYPTYEGD